MHKPEIRKPGTFLYFAYGANIWGYRMHMHCPSAEFVSIARADNYRLDFHRYNKFWGGPEATMVPTANAHVWGVIWRVDVVDKVSFDDQRGMDMKKYYLRHIDVLTPYIGYIHCSAYIQRINPLPMGDNDPIPVERWPSWTYREVMVEGAKEHEFPPFYTEFLSNLKNNGEEGFLRVFCLCVRYGRDKPCTCWVPGRIPRIPLKLDYRRIKALRDMKKEAELKKMQQKAAEIAAKSGPPDAKSGPLEAKSGPLAAKSGPLDAKSGSLAAKSGPLDAKSGPIAAKSGPLDATSGTVAEQKSVVIENPT